MRLTKDNYTDDLFEKQKELIKIDDLFEHHEIHYSQANYNEDLWNAVKEKEDLEEQLGCSLEEIIEFMRLLKKTYYIDNITGLLSERWSPSKSNEKELYKINHIFYKIKDKSE